MPLCIFCIFPNQNNPDYSTDLVLYNLIKNLSCNVEHNDKKNPLYFIILLYVLHYLVKLSFKSSEEFRSSSLFQIFFNQVYQNKTFKPRLFDLD